MNRRNILIGLGAIAAGAAAGGAWVMTRGSGAPAGAGGEPMVLATAAGNMPIYEDDHIMGDANAPVTFIEYASLTCSHCAHFHTATLPKVKSEWIETGRARLVYRHYPLDQLALRAALVAECVKGDGFFGFISVLFENQGKWAFADDPLKAISQYAALAGLGQDTAQACMSDDAMVDHILKRQTDGRDRYNVASTPSFVVNGTPVAGAMEYDEFNSILEQAASRAS